MHANCPNEQGSTGRGELRTDVTEVYENLLFLSFSLLSFLNMVSPKYLRISCRLLVTSSTSAIVIRVTSHYTIHEKTENAAWELEPTEQRTSVKTWDEECNRNAASRGGVRTRLLREVSH